jgi:hypothetical protein
MSQTDPKSSSGCLFGALIAIGLLILIPSGLCTGIVATYSGALPVALMFGGPFVVGGAVMMLIGISGLRRINRKTAQSPPQDPSDEPKPPY